MAVKRLREQRTPLSIAATSMRKKSMAWQAERPKRPALHDPARISSRILAKHEAARRAETRHINPGSSGFSSTSEPIYVPSFDAPWTTLKREVYGYGQAYADAGLVAELRAYVTTRDGAHCWRKNDGDTFFWVARLIAENGQLHGSNESSWSRALRVMTLAHELDIHPNYLELFSIAIGGPKKIQTAPRWGAKPPNWVVGLTRRVQVLERLRTPSPT
jgi:hypothetical protein